MITAIALDDEPLALKIIIQFCERIEFLQLKKAFSDPSEAITYLNENKVDLIFLDIQMHSKRLGSFRIVKINLKDIEFIEALDDYIKIHIKPMPILTLMTLKSVLEKLPSQEFIRIHRSYIIPISKIQKFNKNKIVVGSKEIPIGSSYAGVYDVLMSKSKILG